MSFFKVLVKQNHGITRRSNIGKLNPSIALTEPNMHKNITALQNITNEWAEIEGGKCFTKY